MKIAAVITEYNPFHNGHQYQLEQIRTTYGYDYIIAIMSGNFTQRGIPSITDKYTRTTMALSGGADLVVELPTCYATGSAEFFATGAVSILDSLGCIDALFFGSESGNLDLLKKAAYVLAMESPEFQSALNESLKKGNSYASARLHALTSTGLFTEDDLALLSMPNDILGLEYCKALIRLNSSMEPIAIRRIGTGYHDIHTNGHIASADAIRTMLLSSTPPAISGLVPSHVSVYFDSLISQTKNTQDDSATPFIPANSLLCMDDFSTLLHYQLLMQEDHLDDYQDCTEDIANRIRAALPSYRCATEFIQTLKTKELTYTRINRILTHILLSITKEDIRSYTQNEYLGYARILGFTDRCKGTLLTTLKNNAICPLITKPADFQPTGALASMFRLDILASHIYQSVRMHKSGSALIQELKHSPIIL